MRATASIIFIVALALVLAITAGAAPTLVCDPAPGVTLYRLTGPSWVPATVPAQPDGSIKMDVSAAATGTTSLTVKACETDPVWGEQCSEAVPFDFVRPARPVVSKGLKLVP